MKAVVAFLLLVSVAQAAPYDVPVRIRWTGTKCFAGFCSVHTIDACSSSTVVGCTKTALAILTVAHADRDAPRGLANPRRVNWFWIEGQWYKGEKLDEDVNADLALYRVPYRGSLRPVGVASEIKHMQKCYSHAYIQGNRQMWKVREGHVMLFDRRGGSFTDRMYTSMRYEQGESGGGLFNEDGKLIGVITGHDSHPGNATRTNFGLVSHTRAVNRFLRKHIELHPAPSQTKPKDAAPKTKKPIDTSPLGETTDKEARSRLGQRKDRFERRVSGVNEKLKKVTGSIDGVTGKIKDLKSKVDLSGMETSDKLDQVRDDIKTAGQVAALVGSGAGVVAVGVPIVLWLIRRRRRKKKGEHSDDDPLAGGSPVAPVVPQGGGDSRLVDAFNHLSSLVTGLAGTVEGLKNRPVQTVVERAGDVVHHCDAGQPEQTNIHYKTPVIDRLPTFRRAMKAVSDEYEASRPWVEMFESAFKLQESGEKNHG